MFRIFNYIISILHYEPCLLVLSVCLFCWGVGAGHYVLPANILFIHIKVNLSKRDCTFYVSSAHLAVKIMSSLAWSSIMTMLIYYNVLVELNKNFPQEAPAFFLQSIYHEKNNQPYEKLETG